MSQQCIVWLKNPIEITSGDPEVKKYITIVAANFITDADGSVAVALASGAQTYLNAETIIINDTVDADLWLVEGVEGFTDIRF